MLSHVILTTCNMSDKWHFLAAVSSYLKAVFSIGLEVTWCLDGAFLVPSCVSTWPFFHTKARKGLDCSSLPQKYSEIGRKIGLFKSLKVSRTFKGEEAWGKRLGSGVRQKAGNVHMQMWLSWVSQACPQLLWCPSRGVGGCSPSVSSQQEEFAPNSVWRGGGTIQCTPCFPRPFPSPSR